MSFDYATGFMGGTKPGQKVTPDNLHELPPGSVVKTGDERQIRLHGNLWVALGGVNMWIYDTTESMKRRLRADSTLCHLAPPNNMEVNDA